jgi:hypothetical protein
MQTFRILTFAGLAKRAGEGYDPERGDGKGVVRLSSAWGEKLSAERGDLIRVSSKRSSRIYTLKMSPHLEDDEIALGYEQRVQLRIERRSKVYERELKVAKAPGELWLTCGTTLIRRSGFRSALASGSSCLASY